MDLNDIYQQIILEHSKSKKNKHEIKDFDFEEPGHNPSCGELCHFSGISINNV